MISFEPGIYPLWEGFDLKITDNIMFQSHACVRLLGANGSGKSSFIRKLLIPWLQEQGMHILYLEQQMRIQNYAIRAEAIVSGSKAIPHTDLQVAEYLIERYLDSEKEKPLIVICDEFEPTLSFMAILEQNKLMASYFIVSHANIELPSITLSLELKQANAHLTVLRQI